MGKLFGTDGVRGVANMDLTPALAFELGKYAGHLLSEGKKGKVLVGKDTRASGDMLESALISGLMSIGLDVVKLGVIPTPAVAYLTKKHKAVCGVVISASHNPFEYNGIKFFSSEGFKLPDEVEDKIEEYIFEKKEIQPVLGKDVGIVIDAPELKVQYMDYLKSIVPLDLNGMKVAIDCGNGALSEIAPIVLEELGANVLAVNTKPNGYNINDKCGSTNPEIIKELVVKSGANIGFSFDGDADRIIAVDELGRIVDGDHILAICAKHLKEDGKLSGNKIVGTVMTNIGLDKFLAQEEIGIIKSAVGDRYVLEEMQKGNYVLGGEQSGHIIFLDYNTTGDGLATGLHLLEIMKKSGKKISELNDYMISYPQVLANAKVKNEHKETYLEFDEIRLEIEKIEGRFKSNGRVVIRPSGTEPLVRVMIEGENQEEISSIAHELADLMEKYLG